MRLATVCSGIGSPDLAARRLGWEHVFVSEIDQPASAVLAEHFPEVPNLGDMTKLDGAKYRDAVDVLVGGTPCQGFSAAGKRGGLDDDRSRLAIRFVELVAEIRPRYFVWENVPGVFSSGSGKDLKTFLGLLTGRRIGDGQLRNSGVIVGADSAYSVAWRVLDAQYFGVPQRRRRVFVVGHSDWRRAIEILFEPESLQRHPTPCRKTKQVDHAVAESGVAISVNSRSDNGSANRLGIGKEDYCHVVCFQQNFDGSCQDNKHVSGTLIASYSYTNKCSPFVAFSSNYSGNDAAVEVAPTLRTGSPPAVTASIIRRLTPIECERLQGFPDDWTQVEYRGNPMWDRQRYKMLGNSIAVPVIHWIMNRIHMTR